MTRPKRSRHLVTAARRVYLGLLRCGLTPREARSVIAEARAQARELLARAVVS